MEYPILSGFKLLILIISCLMCCVQLRIAILYLMYPPTVDHTSMKSIEKIDAPLITVCPTNQTNITMLERWFDEPDGVLNGFCGQKITEMEVLKFVFEEQYAVKTNDTFEVWISGLNNDTGLEIYNKNKHLEKKRCWGRPQLNQTHMDLLEDVYDKNMVDGILFQSLAENTNEELKYEIKYLPAYGFCKELTHYDPTLLNIQVLNHFGLTRVFLTDRNSRSYISLSYSSHRGSHILVENGLITRFNVKLQVMSSCGLSGSVDRKDYFTNCVDNEIQSQMGMSIGCVPPWMSANNHCNETYLESRIPDFKYEEFNHDYVRTTLTLRNNPIEEGCKKYCSLTESTVTFRKEENDRTNTTQVSLVFEPEVKKIEIVYSYSLFNFIVDVGSSLGLWLGLSVLSLSDFATYIFIFIREKAPKSNA